MKMIEGLENKQAVVVGDKWLVSLQGTFMVDGVELKANHFQTKQVLVRDLDSIKRIVAPKKNIVAYSEPDGGNIPLGRYSELQRTACEDDFDTVEEEIEAVKARARLSSLTPIYEESEGRLEPVEITVVGACEDTGSRFIESAVHWGRMSFEGSGMSSGAFRVNLGELARHVVEKAQKDFPNKRVDIPTHSNIKFVQVEGKYLFTEMREAWGEKGSVSRVTSSLQEAKEIKQAVEEKVESVMMLHLNPKPLEGALSHEVYKDLGRILANMESLPVKVKGEDSKRMIVNRLKGLMERVCNND